MLGWLAAASWACGGFFCDGYGPGTTTSQYSVPVQQNGERILFEVNPDDTVTTFVEVGYQQTEDVDFAWVIPIPAAIDASSIQTQSADLLNALELATAPEFTFHRPVYGGYTGYGSDGRGCGCGCRAYSSATDSAGGSEEETTETTAVAVVDEAVTGPFDIQIITATDGAAFADWLAANGYQLPPNAVDPLQHYIDLGQAFLGVRLAPDASYGPVDTLEFTYPGTMPMIPLILTSIASADELPIEAWILADDPYMATNWAFARDVAPDVQPNGPGGSDYLDRVRTELAFYDGRAFELELSGPTRRLSVPGFDELVHERRWLTRWRGEIAPAQMTVDPEFAPEDLPRYSNRHDVYLTSGYTPSYGSESWIVAPLGMIGWLRRRRLSGR